MVLTFKIMRIVYILRERLTSYNSYTPHLTKYLALSGLFLDLDLYDFLRISIRVRQVFFSSDSPEAKFGDLTRKKCRQNKSECARKNAVIRDPLAVKI